MILPITEPNFGIEIWLKLISVLLIAPENADNNNDKENNENIFGFV